MSLVLMNFSLLFGMLFDVNFHLETKKEAQIMKYSISIPKPCHENWNNMTPTEKGAFCSNCQKEVIDFTSKSNRELAKSLRKKEPLCGKFRPEQLNVELAYREDSRASKFGFLLGLSGLLSFSMPVFAQTFPVETSQEQVDISSEKEQVVNEVVGDTLEIKGRVLDEKGKALPMSNIVIKKTKKDGKSYVIRGVSADFDGNYIIRFDRSKVGEEFNVEFSFVGMQRKVLTFKTSELQNQTNLNVELEDSNMILGVVIHESDRKPKKRSLFTRIANIFRKKENRR
ncbi:MAG: carboxypeptidase-like regulatory domain-containing protein [Flavobacteriales bacterium]